MIRRVLVAIPLILAILPVWPQNVQKITAPYSKYELSIPAKPIDQQVIRDQDKMTWDDYKPIPGKNWADPSLIPERKFRMALVAVDFPD